MQIREVTFEIESGRIIREPHNNGNLILIRGIVWVIIFPLTSACVFVCVDGYAAVTPTGVGTHAEVSRHGPST